MGVLLVIRFLAELAMLACLAIGGWLLGPTLLASMGFAVAFPSVAALVWGRWIAPRAAHRLDDPMRLGVEVSLFTAAVLVLGAGDAARWSTLLGIGVWTAFLVSIPARGHEPVPPAR